jgi:Fe-S-cluster-containing dehydrogenase component
MASPNVMAIVQDVDKCVRCNGCVIACKRTWHLKGITAGRIKPNQKISINQRMVIKPQRKVDLYPFVRYACWHCTKPPCTSRCPWGAIKKDADSGAVYIDQGACKPDTVFPATGKKCLGVCQSDCVQGGYIKIGSGTDAFTDPLIPGSDMTQKAQKCTMCYGRAGLAADLPSKAQKVGSTYYSPFFPKTLTEPGRPVPELGAQPACVYSCPAKAMFYDTRVNAVDYIRDGLEHGTIVSACGDGSMFWFSRRTFVSPPKADPFIEDHVSPMVSSLLNSPFARAALVPTLVAGGLIALSARRASIEAEQTSLTGGVA